jgi:hypothetical protein
MNSALIDFPPNDILNIVERIIIQNVQSEPHHFSRAHLRATYAHKEGEDFRQSFYSSLSKYVLGGRLQQNFLLRDSALWIAILFSLFFLYFVARTVAVIISGANISIDYLASLLKQT